MKLQCEVREGVRLSPQQRHVWLLQQNDQRLYRSYCVVIVEGKLRMDILAAALRETVCRHEILRSIFYRLPSINVPLQVVTDTEIPLGPPLDLSALDQRQQDHKIEEIFRELRHADFQLEHGPLLQTSVAILGSEKYALLITAPALYSDAKGLRNLVEEISRCYTASLEEETPEDKPIQYADLAEWHNELLESEETEAGRSYWRKQGRACVSSPRLPFELTGTIQSGFAPRFVRAKLPPEIVGKLETLARNKETSVSSFLLGCWQVLLCHHSGRSNIVVGAFYDGRKYEELRDAIGLLARHLPVQCRIPESLPFDKLLKQIDERLNGLFKWQEYFNWEYFDQSNVEGAGDAFFHFCFEFESEWPNYSSEHLGFTFQQQYSCFDRFKIKLWSALQHGQLSLECHYDSELFRPEDIERLLSEYQTLLGSALLNPHSQIAELEILSTLEREQLLVDLNNKPGECSQEQCVHQLFEQNAAISPNDTAVRYEDTHLNYAELNVRANQLAHHLQALGVGPDTAVAICLERSLQMIVSILGILKAGGAYVPLDPALPTERLSYMLEDSDALVLVTEKRLLDALYIRHEKIVCLDTCSERIVRERKENPVSKAGAHNLAYVIYTSGSTGRPKGVAIEHQQLLNYLNSICQELKLTDHASFATVSTFAADLGNTSVFPALCSGGSLHVISQETAGNPDALGDYFRRHNIDCLKIVPSHLSALLESSRPSNILPRQWLILGGEACSWELVRQIQELGGTCQILSHYGPTEATVGVLTYKVKPDESPTFTKNVPLGRPLANDKIYLLNSCLKPVSIWMQGELHIGGNGLARGYVNHPALTAEKFLPDPFSAEPGSRLYRTGDLARFLPDRNIEFLGRIDHQVKINGYRIEPGEIEVVLRQHPLINEALVFPREDDLGEKRLVVYLVHHDAQELDTGDLRNFLRRQLPEYMVPSVFISLKTLPLTANGKIDYRALPEPDQTLRKAKAPFIVPRDQLERQIAEIWQEILGMPVIGVHDNFFDLGGHSLLAVRLVALIKRRLGLTLPLAALFRGATVEQLASILRQEGAAKISSPLIGVQPHGSKTPLFCVHPSGGLVFCYGALSNHLGTEQPFYGFQARGVEGEQNPHESVEEMAADYIEALRSVQPNGPYSLGGWSMGGLIAFEMARQLQEQGEEIKLLALLDTRIINRFSRRAPIDELDLAVGFGLLLGLSPEQLRISWSHLVALEPEEQLKYIVESAKAADIMLPEKDLSHLNYLFAVVKKHVTARKNYVPRPYAGRITLLYASQPFTSAPTRSRVVNTLRGASPGAKAFRRVVKGFLDPTMGWSAIASEGVDLYEVPGNHFTMIREPNVRVLAERLRVCLDEASTKVARRKFQNSQAMVSASPVSGKGRKDNAMRDVVVSLSNVSKSFNSVVAVNDVSFSVQRGETFGLLGPNGAGKTTLIRMIMDILRPDSGTVEVLGHRMESKDKRLIGYLPEERGLYARQKVLSMLEYLALLRGLSREEGRSSALSWLDRLEMTEVKDKKIGELSKGNQQKVQLIATLVADPEIIILDEPFSGLDPINMRTVSTLMRELVAAGKTIFLSAHQMSVVETLCQRVFMINRGKGVLYGEIDEIKKQYSDNAVLVKSTADYDRCGLVSKHISHNGSRKVYLNNGGDQRKFLAWLVSEGADVESFERSSTPLEEIFIKVVEEKVPVPATTAAIATDNQVT